MYERVKSLYGDQSIVEVLPGVPLVFARDVPGSLTTTDTTHAFSEFLVYGKFIALNIQSGMILCLLLIRLIFQFFLDIVHSQHLPLILLYHLLIKSMKLSCFQILVLKPRITII